MPEQFEDCRVSRGTFASAAYFVSFATAEQINNCRALPFPRLSHPVYAEDLPESEEAGLPD